MRGVRLAIRAAGADSSRGRTRTGPAAALARCTRLLPFLAADGAAAVAAARGPFLQLERRRQPWWRSWLSVLGGMLVGSAAIGVSSVALCRPFDTPSYLIPYYLRDVRSRFNHYASVKKHKGGPAYMNAEDFVLALLASPDKELKDPSIVSDLKDLFDSFDANGDGYISFPEFRFLLSLLTCKNEEVEVLFRVVDEEGAGTITLGQFSEVLRGLTKDEAAARSLLRRKRSGITLKLFGDKASPRRCSYAELAALIDRVRVEVWKAEFRLYDTARTNYISAEQFSELLAKQVLGVHLPYYIVENIRKLRKEAETAAHANGGRSGSPRFDVSLDDWISFHRLMLKGETLAEAVELYCASGLPMTRQSFERVLRATDMPLPDMTVDVVFAVFDRDGDGTIAMDEFMSLMKQKIRYHYQTAPRVRKALPTRLRECSSAAVAELLHG